LTAAKMLEKRPPCVDHKMARIMITMELIRPTATRVASDICGRKRFTISTATSVPELLSAA
jgi:hypothetical protein